MTPGLASVHISPTFTLRSYFFLTSFDHIVVLLYFSIALVGMALIPLLSLFSGLTSHSSFLGIDAETVQYGVIGHDYEAGCFGSLGATVFDALSMTGTTAFFFFFVGADPSANQRERLRNKGRACQTMSIKRKRFFCPLFWRHKSLLSPS